MISILDYPPSASHLRQDAVKIVCLEELKSVCLSSIPRRLWSVINLFLISTPILLEPYWASFCDTESIGLRMLAHDRCWTTLALKTPLPRFPPNCHSRRPAPALPSDAAPPTSWRSCPPCPSLSWAPCCAGWRTPLLPISRWRRGLQRQVGLMER